MTQARLQIAQALIRLSNGSELFRMMLRSELLDEFEIAAPNRFIIAVGRQTENGVGIIHEMALHRGKSKTDTSRLSYQSGAGATIRRNGGSVRRGSTLFIGSGKEILFSVSATFIYNPYLPSEFLTGFEPCARCLPFVDLESRY